MPFPVARKGDNSTGHGNWPPNNIVGACSENVFTNMIMTAKVGSTYATHCCITSHKWHNCHCHDSILAMDFMTTTYCNGVQIGHILSIINCGGGSCGQQFQNTGSGNVFCGH